MIEKCRLCSSSTALITLTSGKCRQNRDYIRKLIAITTGIQFKKNEALSLVCITCMVQIYNFYLFRTRSLQNEKQLEELTREHEIVPRRNKVPIPDLCDITIPDVEDLKNILLPWIQSKVNVMVCSEYENSFLSESDKTDTSKKTELDRRSDISTQTTASTVVMIDEEVQVGPPATWNVSVQTLIKTADEKIQCRLRTSTSDVFSQTDLKCEDQETQSLNIIETKDEKIQCRIRTSTTNVFSQTDLRYEDQETQSVNVFETKDEGIQCEIFESVEPTMKIEACGNYSVCLKNIMPTIEKKMVDDTIMKSSSCKSNGKLIEESDSDKDITLLTALCLKSRRSINQEKVVKISPQRDTRQARLKQASVSPRNVSWETVYANKERVSVENNSNEIEKSSLKLNNENSKREEETVLLVLEKESCGKKTDCRENIKQIENISKAFEIINKQSGSEKLSSETSLGKSRMNQLNTETVEGKSNSPKTPNRKKLVDLGRDERTQGGFQPLCLKFDSPRSSQLLHIKNKVQYVKICKECDHTMYSKSEVVVHRKSHMRCPMCKKRFTSIVKTKIHMSLECDQKMSSMIPVVELNKMKIPHDALDSVKKELIEMNSPNKRRKNHILMSPGKKFKG